MTRTRRLTLIAAGLALAAGASLGAGAAQADTAPATVLRSDYILCTGLDGAGGVCVEDPVSTLEKVPSLRQILYELTGVPISA